MIKLMSLFFLFVITAVHSFAADSLQLYSPDKNIRIKLSLKGKIYYSVEYKSEMVVNSSPLTLTINNTMLGAMPELMKVTSIAVDEPIDAVWGGRKTIRDYYNGLSLQFNGGFKVHFRAYNNGIAYRFETLLKDKEVTVNDEEVAIRFNFGTKAWIMDGQSYESNYRIEPLDVAGITDFKTANRKIYLPVIAQATSNTKIAITEAGLYDYPSLFLKRGNDYENYLLGTFEKYALTTKIGGFSNYSYLADKEASYIAKTAGERTYPWRLLVISDNDATFADCDLVFQLSKPSVIKESAWIKPGKVAWDWWHDYAVSNVDFKSGINTPTYLYQIDFAAKYGLEYIMVDWLWTDKYDLTLVNPEVDVEKIINYAKSKNIGVILWCPGHTLHNQLDKALDLFAGWGAAGVKADFFGREDQTGIKMYEDIASAAARRKLLVDFHGAAKPTGLSRTYPNVINYEAVLGNEFNKLEDKCTALHKTILPFTRALQGPMDFTPGGMRNTVKDYAVFFTLPMVHGTRCNEMALFVLYNEPLKMFADAPQAYEQEPVVTKFLARIPTTWTDSKVLDGKIGEYIVTARKTGSSWYVGGITNETARTAVVDCSFLDEGLYSVQMFVDGPNADRIATDYKISGITAKSTDKLAIKLAGSGGMVLRFDKVN